MCAVLLAAFACTADDPRAEIRAECGAAPVDPGLVAAFDQGHVTMTREHFDQVSAWRDAMIAWRSCVEGP